MPTYTINGHRYSSPTELSDEEIDEIAGWDSPQPEVKSTWTKLNTPFTNVPSTLGKKIGQWIDPEQGTDWRNPRTALGAFAESVGNTVENMFFTPMGAAMTLAFPGSSALSRAAVTPAITKAAPTIAKQLPTAAKAVHTGARAASGLYGLEGGRTMLDAESFPEFAMGAAEAAGGIWGARSKFKPYELPPDPNVYRGTRFPGQPKPWQYQPFPGRPNVSTQPPGGPPPPPPPSRFPGVPRPPNTPPPTSPIPNTPPPNITTPSVINPVTESIADTIRKINQKQAAAPPPIAQQFADQVVPQAPEQQINQALQEAQAKPVVEQPFEDPFTPVTEPPPVVNVGPELPHPDTLPPSTEPLPPNPDLAVTAAEDALDRPMTIEDRAKAEAVIDQMEANIDAGKPSVQEALETIRQITGKPVSGTGKKGGLKPRQKFETYTFPQGPPKPPAGNKPVVPPTPPVTAPAPPAQQAATTALTDISPNAQQTAMQAILDIDQRATNLSKNGITDSAQWNALKNEQLAHLTTLREALRKGRSIADAEDMYRNATGSLQVLEQQATKRAGKPRLVPKTPTATTIPESNAPSNAPALEHAIATNGEQLDQLMKDGFKVVGKRTDGAIVMERPAPVEQPIKQPSMAEQIEAAQKRTRDEFNENKRRLAAQWGPTRAKAKELGIDIRKERDIKKIEKMIQEKDPNWRTPEYHGNVGVPSIATEMAPPKGKEPSFRPGGVKHGLKVEPEIKPEGRVRQWYNEARGLMSVDFPLMTSAAFRQGLPFIGTKYWRSAFKPAAQAYKSQEAYQQVMLSIEKDKLFMPQVDPRRAGGRVELSIAERLGLKFIKAGDIGGAEGVGRGPLTSRYKLFGYVRASDRSFAAFTNHLRAWTFKRLLKDADVWDEASGMIKNEALAREIADFVNTASGRGKLEIGYGRHKAQTRSLESSSKILTDLFFSPRLMFSRMKMMNPATYMQADPYVRKQYVSAMIRSIGAWWTIASLAEWGGKLAGEQVVISKDPNNADYGKIRIGNTRIDPGGGFQQFLVLTHRLMPAYGKQKPLGSGIAAVDLAAGLLMAGGGTTTSSVTGNKSSLGVGYKPETRRSLIERFVSSKFHPAAKLAWDVGSATEKYPVYMGDRLLQMAMPMMVPDVIEALQKDPEMAPLIFFASNLGMGAQTYEGGRVEKPAITPFLGLDKMDWAYGGGGAK